MRGGNVSNRIRLCNVRKDESEATFQLKTDSKCNKDLHVQSHHITLSRQVSLSLKESSIIDNRISNINDSCINMRKLTADTLRSPMNPLHKDILYNDYTPTNNQLYSTHDGLMNNTRDNTNTARESSTNNKGEIDSHLMIPLSFCWKKERLPQPSRVLSNNMHRAKVNYSIWRPASHRGDNDDITSTNTSDVYESMNITREYVDDDIHLIKCMTIDGCILHDGV